MNIFHFVLENAKLEESEPYLITVPMSTVKLKIQAKGAF